MAEDKGHAPSRKRLEEARKQGQVLKAPLFTQSISLLVALGLVWALLESVWVKVRLLLEYDVRLDVADLSSLLGEGALLVLTTVLAILGPPALVASLVEIAQVGWKVETAALAPKFERLNPVSGLRRIFGAIPSMLSLLAGVSAVSVAGGIILWYALPVVAALVGAPVESVLATSRALVFRLILVATGVLVICGAVQYVYKRRKFYLELSMSTDELRREHREEEGDPHIRHARKQLHSSLAREELVARVRRSRVVVVERSGN